MGKYKSSTKEIGKKFKASSDLYDWVMNNSTMKGQRSLINLKKMCDDLQERGVELTLASIDREACRLDISPKHSALANNPKLLNYVVLRQKEGIHKAKGVKKDEDLVELVFELKKEIKVLRAFIKRFNVNNY